jgi:Phage derived protein Gp49-like (DUF891)
MRLHLAYNPNRLQATHPRLIEDLLEFVEQQEQLAVNSMILMIEDLYQQGLDSRFVKKLKHLPIFELKTRSRGGGKGGARVYFFTNTKNEAILCNAEIKEGNSPNQQKLEEAAEMFLAYEAGIDILRNT